MIKAVIFDYGSVLSRTLELQPRRVWEQKLGLDPGDLERAVHNDGSWVEAQCGRMTVDAYWDNVGAQLGLAPANIAQLRVDFYRGDRRNNPLVVRIDAMRKAGLQTAILSNFSTELRPFLAQQDLLHRFDHIAISAEIGAMKPGARAYQSILDMLSLPASARRVWEQKLGLEPGDLQRAVHNDGSWVEAQCGRMTVDAYWDNVGAQLGLAPANIAQLRVDFYRGDRRNNPLVVRIDAMRKAGLQTAILSNFSTELRPFLAQQDLLHRFDHIAISAEIAMWSKR